MKPMISHAQNGRPAAVALAISKPGPTFVELSMPVRIPPVFELDEVDEPEPALLEPAPEVCEDEAADVPEEGPLLEPPAVVGEDDAAEVGPPLEPPLVVGEDDAPPVVCEDDAADVPAEPPAVEAAVADVALWVLPAVFVVPAEALLAEDAPDAEELPVETDAETPVPEEHGETLHAAESVLLPVHGAPPF